MGHLNAYAYDGEGRIFAAQTIPLPRRVAYGLIFYAEGKRVAEGVVGQTPTTDFLYDLDGRLVTTVGSNLKMIRTSLYAAGRHWGDYTAGTGSGGGSTQYRLTNEVGSLYFNFDQTGKLLETCGLGVFGESLSCNPSVDFTETHFADEKRDQESNLDYMGARYYSSTLGRFMSPDPSGLFYADPSNPQSLNLYSYAQNNPLTNTDPTGLDCVYFNDAGNGVESVDHNTNSGECGSNGGDYVNGTTSASQIQYNANSDTFNIQSSSTFHNYNSTAYAPGPGGGGTGVPCSGNCDTANGYSSSFKLPLPQFTFQVGFSINYGVGPVATTAFTGLIVDSHGHFGRYGGGGAGLGFGAGGSAGVQVGLSNGNGVCSYGGPFGNVSLTGGDGVGGTLDGFAGYGDGPGGVVSGSSITLGVAGGADAAATITETKVTPFGGKKCQ